MFVFFLDIKYTYIVLFTYIIVPKQKEWLIAFKAPFDKIPDSTKIRNQLYFWTTVFCF